jgi:hypothetical protein
MGWREGNQWHTLYTWLASDVTFVGVPLIIFLMGRILAQSWIDAVAKASPYAVVLFALLTIAVFYASANNQVLQTSETVTVFWAVLVLWLSGRRKALRAAERQIKGRQRYVRIIRPGWTAT